MHCPICGTLNGQAAEVCVECGTKLQEIVDNYARELAVYASFLQRALALFVDSFIYPVICTVVMFSLIYTGVVAELYRWEMTIIFLACGFLYFTLFESSALQGTPGKKLLGIKVTDLSGNRLDLHKAASRSFAKALSWIPFGAGFFLVLFTEQKQALHDKMVGSLVVRS